jgi:hypothetical protein
MAMFHETLWHIRSCPDCMRSGLSGVLTMQIAEVPYPNMTHRPR